MNKQIKRHLDRRRIRLSHGRQTKGLLGTESGTAAFLRWFHEDVMMFDSKEYRRQFWREAYRHGHTIGHMPRTAIEFTDPRLHRYNEWLARLLFLMVAMGVSAVVWWLVRTIDAHIRCLRRPTYYEAERQRRLGLAEERRRIRKRQTNNPCPTPDMLRAAFDRVLETTENMIRFGSMLEDLECYVDNSVVWSETEGRIVGRRGGIRQWLRENAPDLWERYKTVMKYKALAKRFRQAVGVLDPLPATAVLPPEPFREEETEGEGETREYCSELILNGRDKNNQRHRKKVTKRNETPMWKRASRDIEAERTTEHRQEQLKEIARELLERCEGTVVSLSAQLALMVSADFVMDENIDRKKVLLRRGESDCRVGRQSSA